MIILTSTNQLFSVTMQADNTTNPNEALLYTLSNSMLRVKKTNPSMAIANVELDNGLVVKSTDYYTDPSGAVEFPLKNYVNQVHADGISAFAITISMKDLDGNDIDGNIAVKCIPLAGVSFYDLRVPQSPYPQDKIYIVEPNMEILPPTVMFMQSYGGVNAVDQLLSGVVVESTLSTIHSGAAWAYGYNGNYTAINPTGERDTQIVVSNRAQSLRFNSVDANYEWMFKTLSYFDCQDAVVIRWRSLTGATRQHWFPVVGYERDTDKEMSLLSAGDGYNVRKNPYLALRCRLDGLTAYDVWYYQDLLQASEVHAICRSRWRNLPPFLTAINSTLTYCQIEGGTPQTPQGNGLFSFEFIVKTKHYDAI